MRFIGRDDLTAREWSGGTTTELAIYPGDAVYADRDFLWRLSTAEVLDEKSEFTKLPDYRRFLTTRSGVLRLKHDDGPWYTLRPGEVTEFDGGALTLSEGRVTDFNLMVRKDAAEGRLLSASIDAKDSAKAIGEVFTELWPDADIIATAVYLSSGGPLTAGCGGVARELAEGEMIVFERNEPASDISICPAAPAVLLCAQLREL